MGLRKGQVLFNHVFQHEEEVTLGVVLAMPQQRVGLGLGDLLVLQGFDDQFAHIYFGSNFFVKPDQNLFPGSAL